MDVEGLALVGLPAETAWSVVLGPYPQVVVALHFVIGTVTILLGVLLVLGKNSLRS